MKHGSGIEWIAHRGASFDALENTLAAIELAWRQGVDAVEIDVRLTADGYLVLSHDEDAQRMANSAKVIATSTLAELRQLDFGGGQPIADIYAALRTIPPGKRMFVEIKCGIEAVEVLATAMRETGVVDKQVVVISFNAGVIRESKKRLPAVAACWLSDFGREGNAWEPSIERVISTAKESCADGVDLCHAGPIDQEYVSRLKAAGLGVYVWTVDEQEIAQRMIAAGVNGITSNRAGWVKERIG